MEWRISAVHDNLSLNTTHESSFCVTAREEVDDCSGVFSPPLKHHLRLSSSLEVRDEQWQLETVEIRDCFGVELIIVGPVR